ncbi:MAG: 4-hydroxy-tetrahydrodipicolinate synthase [Anaerolineae bacterium]|nr:4-hydroxy-tetrahydrodipicolinate synthase [Phycisphaerae bacterium]
MFSGAITAMITPFREGRVDEGRLRDQIDLQIKGGIDALVPMGTTGESPTLSIEEHQRFIEQTIKHVAGRVPVIAGVGANSTAEAMELHAFAKKVGATAGLSVNPYYNKPSQEGLYRHFMAIAEKIDLPIVLYNVPSRSAITMQPSTVARLRRANPQRFVAIKEATGSLDLASEIMSLCDITVISGDDSLTLPLMSIGARGVISVLSNLLPAPVKQLTKLALAGNFSDARAIHHRLFPLTKAIFADGNPAGVKHAMKLAGIDGGEMRLPLVDANDATKSAIAEQMKKLDLPTKST